MPGFVRDSLALGAASEVTAGRVKNHAKTFRLREILTTKQILGKLQEIWVAAGSLLLV